MAFAGLLLLITGTLNFIDGLAAIGNSHFFVANLNTWGWNVLCIGVIRWLVGLGCSPRTISHWVEVIVLSLNAIAQLLIPAYPLWWLAIFAVDMLAIYGLVAYGQRSTRTPDHQPLAEAGR